VGRLDRVFSARWQSAIASNRETTQSTLADLMVWAAGLSAVYLVGALERALRIAEQPPVISRLAAAEYEALDDAVRLESKAKIDELTAETDRIAAGTARLEAEQIHRERIAAEAALAAAQEASATLDAATHEVAAREARAVAADAARRTRRAASKIARPAARRPAKHK
jgi:hypothetical protein